jgi:multiple sugar transport system substrate-binding protein
MKGLNRREFLRLAAMSAAGITLAACGAPATTVPAAPTTAGVPPTAAPAAPTTGAATPTAPVALSTKPMTLQFPSWQQDEPGSSDWFKARIADFTKAHPNVTIEFTKVAVGDIATKDLAAFAGGTPPQIVHLPYLNMLQFADQGFLEPLDDWMKDTDIAKVWSPIQQGCVWKGKTYAILLLGYGYALIYNQKLYQDAGVSIPKTSDDFVKAVKALTKKPDQFGYGAVTVPGNNMLNHIAEFIIGNGGRLTTNGKPSVNTPEAVLGFSQYVDIVKSGASPTGMDSGPLRQLLQQGKIANYLDGPFGQGFIKTAAPDILPNLKATRAPFKNIFGGNSNIVAMPASIPMDQKQMVWEFIKSLLTPASQKDYALKYCVAPARLDVVIPPDELHASCPLIVPWLDALKSPDLVDYYPFGFETKITDLIKLVSATGQTLITSNASVKDECDKLQKAMEDLQKS